jgi:hypothetical protein
MGDREIGRRDRSGSHVELPFLLLARNVIKQKELSNG